MNKKTTRHIKRIALYVIYDKDGLLDGFRKYYLQELRKVTDRIVAVVSGTLTPESRDELEKLADDIYVRENKGLLAGAWIDGLAYVGWDTLYQYDELLMLNDSFFGPFFPIEELFEKAEASDADFYGCMQNFEEKAITQIQGRPLKHGHFRGSICYFYIIKNRLLHSRAFKDYWTQKPVITQDWETYFFTEFDFYDYVRDAGFRIDAYQSDKLKGYFFDNLTHNMSLLVEQDRIPFVRIRPFGNDMKDQSMQIHYGKDPRQTLEYIDKHTDYDVNLIWDYLLRTKNLTHLYNQLQLQYVLPKDCVERPFKYDKKIAVILHIYYEDLVEKMAEYCQNFPPNTDFFVTTTDEKTAATIHKEFTKRSLSFVCKVRPNKGVAMSSLWITYAHIVTEGKYEYVCYFHDKKSPYTGFAVSGAEFGRRCYENLFGTPQLIKNIINLFEEHPRLGVVGAPQPYHGIYFSTPLRSWPGNYQNTVHLAQRLGLKVNISPDIMPVAPYGDMFWCRSKALSKMLKKGLTWKDFDVEYKPDFTIMHAIERIYSFAAQDAGFYYADVINTDEARSDLINFQYLINRLCQIMLSKGEYPATFAAICDIVRKNASQPPVLIQWKNNYYYWKYRILWHLLHTQHYKEKYQMVKAWKKMQG